MTVSQRVPPKSRFGARPDPPGAKRDEAQKAHFRRGKITSTTETVGAVAMPGFNLAAISLSLSFSHVSWTGRRRNLRGRQSRDKYCASPTTPMSRLIREYISTRGASRQSRRRSVVFSRRRKRDELDARDRNENREKATGKERRLTKVSRLGAATVGRLGAVGL